MMHVLFLDNSPALRMLLSTSQRIALRFTLTIAVIVFVLGIVINAIFFWSRRRREQARFAPLATVADLTSPTPRERLMLQQMQRKFAKQYSATFGPRDILLIDAHGMEAQELQEHTVRKNISHIDDEWYLYRMTPAGDELVIVDISMTVNNQIILLWITLITVIVCSLIGYGVSLIVVKKSLRDLHTLAEKVQKIDVDTLETKFTFAHLPAHDEMQIVASSLQQMTTTVHEQVQAIKQFVANVSHEFKTPLMSLQSTIEVAQKTKQYDHLFTQVREQVGSMQRLLDTLTMLTRLHTTTTHHHQKIVLAPFLGSLVTNMQRTYPNHTRTLNCDTALSIQGDVWILERIVTNLLDNAGKFTPVGGQITISATTHHLTIEDTWAGIAPDDLAHIREPFWQSNSARSTTWFGLWLSLVKQLVAVMDRKISVKSELGKGTTFTLHWYS